MSSSSGLYFVTLVYVIMSRLKFCVFFFFKQKTAYDMRISDWISDVCSSDLLGPKEGLALLNGTQFSTANALAGLFRAETVFRSALITGALSTEAAKGSDAPFDERLHALRGHAGQREVGDALRTLMAGSAIPAPHAEGPPGVQDHSFLACQPPVLRHLTPLFPPACSAPKPSAARR